jgi:hypothetical protein
MQGITVDKVLTLAGPNAASLFPGQPPPKELDVDAVAALVQQDHEYPSAASHSHNSAQ